jgi:hypothetical protein
VVKSSAEKSAVKHLQKKFKVGLHKCCSILQSK